MSTMESQNLLSGVQHDEEKAAAFLLDREEQDAPEALEYQYPANVKLAFLAGYMVLNLSMTIYSKALLQHIPCPWLLTTLHTTFTSIGCGAYLLQGRLKLSTLSTGDHLKLLAFSLLFTINIAISNVSLSMVSVPIHQTIRSCCPLFAVGIYRFFYGRQYSAETQLSLIPVVFGAALAAYGDISYSSLGLALTVLGAFLASIKTIATNRVMTGSLALPAIEVLARMSPMAAVQSLAFALASREDKVLVDALSQSTHLRVLGLAIIGNGAIALLLNLASFQTNKLAGALALTVCANVKQTLTIVMGIVAFNVHIGFLNGLGMAITATGAAWFSRIELSSKRSAR